MQSTLAANHRNIRLSWFATAPLLVLLGSVGTAIAFWGFTADDAYIVARYSANLVSGRGLIFNTGEYVSALTSPAEAFVLAALSGWSIDALALYKLVSVVTVGMSLFLANFGTFRENSERLLFLSATAASPFVVMWSIGGLETPLLLSVATWLACLCFRPISRLTFGVAVLLASVGFLVRYDSALFSAPIVLAMGWRAYQARTLSILHVLPLILPIAWLIFAYRYYGDIFPTSLYVKAPRLSLLELLKGAGYEASALAMSGLWLFLPLVSKRKLDAPSSPSTYRDRPMAIALSVGLVLVLLYGLSAGAKHMMFGYRLFVPYLPGFVFVLMRVAPRVEDRKVKRTVAAVLTWQATMIYAVWNFSVNPTLATPWKLYEYSRVSIRSYANDFLGALDNDARSIVTHWREVSSAARPPPRIATYAGGRIPYLIPDAYVYEGLVSYRKNCTHQWSQFADYTMILYPRHGSRESQLGELAGHGQIISQRLVEFDGSLEHFEVWYNSKPKSYMLPARISDPCM